MIDDGFERKPATTTETSTISQPSVRGISPSMVFAAFAVAILTGVLGFLGGMQVNKTSSVANGGMAPPTMGTSGSTAGTMTPPNGQMPGSATGGTGTSGTNTSTSSTSTSTN